MSTGLTITVAAVLSAKMVSPAFAQQDLSEVEIRTEQVAPGIAVLFGAGGNIGVSYGEDGTILIDDQFAPLTAKIQAAIAGMGAEPVTMLVNTHWHGDHAGGNANFGETGATIFAHDNVRIRLAEGRPDGERPIPPAPPAALPVVTYGQGLTFHRNGDTVEVLFTGGGHTDGDSIIRWREKNVVHMGDLFFNIPGYPFIDTNSGGNAVHALLSVDASIRMMDDETIVIPGHGAVTDKAALIAYRAMLEEAIALIRSAKDEGMSLEQVIAGQPLANFNRGEGFIGPDAFVGAIYRSLEAHPGE